MRNVTRALLPIMALAGLGAGIAVWALIDVLPERSDDERLVLAITAVSVAFLASFLASVGPLRPGAALLAGLTVALPSACLFWGASFRFDAVGPFLETGHAPAVFAILAVLALPFTIAALRFDQDPTNYTALFENSWGIVTRTVAALAFVALFWGVLLLSNVLLQLVEIDWIERAIDEKPVPFGLTGLAGGLALAVAHRMSGVIGPDVLIQLMRLLLPLVAVVTGVFLIALAMRGPAGLDTLFGTFSAAATLMSVGYGATVLIAAAVERGGLRAVRAPAMRGAVAALSLMLPALAILAALAVQARVAQYGWTPSRLVAATGAVLLCGYGATHAVAVVLRGEWMQRIRQGNVLMAAVVILTAALWLNPAIGPEKIAAHSLESRLAADPVGVTDRDLEILVADYGRAGQAALARIEAAAAPALKLRIAEARRRAGDPATRHPAEEDTRPVVLSGLRDTLAVRPDGASFPEAALDGIDDVLLLRLRAACARPTPGGAPGCAVFVADLLPDLAGDEVVVLYLRHTDDVAVFARSADGADWLPLNAVAGNWPDDPAIIDRLLAGEATLAAPPAMAVTIGGHILYPPP